MTTPKTYLIAVPPEPVAVEVKKEWKYRGFDLFLHRNGLMSGYPPRWVTMKGWRASEKTTGRNAGGYASGTMKEAIADIQEKLDRFLSDPSRKPADLLAQFKTINP